MDDAFPYASELITEACRVVAIGADGLAENVADTLDLGGRTVIPGFADAHCHQEMFAIQLNYAGQCFVPPHRSISDIGDKRRKRRKRPNPGRRLGRMSSGRRTAREPVMSAAVEVRGLRKLIRVHEPDLASAAHVSRMTGLLHQVALDERYARSFPRQMSGRTAAGPKALNLLADIKEQTDHVPVQLP